jgi:hypothetical protein
VLRNLINHIKAWGVVFGGLLQGKSLDQIIDEQKAIQARLKFSANIREGDEIQP